MNGEGETVSFSNSTLSFRDHVSHVFDDALLQATQSAQQLYGEAATVRYEMLHAVVRQHALSVSSSATRGGTFSLKESCFRDLSARAFAIQSQRSTLVEELHRLANRLLQERESLSSEKSQLVAQQQRKKRLSQKPTGMEENVGNEEVPSNATRRKPMNSIESSSQSQSLHATATYSRQIVATSVLSSSRWSPEVTGVTPDLATHRRGRAAKSHRGGGSGSSGRTTTTTTVTQEVVDLEAEDINEEEEEQQQQEQRETTLRKQEGKGASPSFSTCMMEVLNVEEMEVADDLVDVDAEAEMEEEEEEEGRNHQNKEKGNAGKEKHPTNAAFHTPPQRNSLPLQDSQEEDGLAMYTARYLLRYFQEEERAAEVVLPLAPSQGVLNRFYREAITGQRLHRCGSLATNNNSNSSGNAEVTNDIAAKEGKKKSNNAEPDNNVDDEDADEDDRTAASVEKAFAILWQRMQEETEIEWAVARGRAAEPASSPNSSTTTATPTTKLDEGDKGHDAVPPPPPPPAVVMPLFQSLFQYAAEAPWLEEQEEETEAEEAAEAGADPQHPHHHHHSKSHFTTSRSASRLPVLERMRRQREAHRIRPGFALPPHALLGNHFVVPDRFLPTRSSVANETPGGGFSLKTTEGGAGSTGAGTGAGGTTLQRAAAERERGLNAEDTFLSPTAPSNSRPWGTSSSAGFRIRRGNEGDDDADAQRENLGDYYYEKANRNPSGTTMDEQDDVAATSLLCGVSLEVKHAREGGVVRSVLNAVEYLWDFARSADGAPPSALLSPPLSTAEVEGRGSSSNSSACPTGAPSRTLAELPARLSLPPEHYAVPDEEERERIEAFLHMVSMRLALEIAARVLAYQEAVVAFCEGETSMTTEAPQQRCVFVEPYPLPRPSNNGVKKESSSSSSVDVTSTTTTPLPSSALIRLGRWRGVGELPPPTTGGITTPAPDAGGMVLPAGSTPRRLDVTRLLPMVVLPLPEGPQVFYCLAYCLGAALQLEHLHDQVVRLRQKEKEKEREDEDGEARLNEVDMIDGQDPSDTALTRSELFLTQLARRPVLTPLLRCLRLWLYLWQFTLCLAPFHVDRQSDSTAKQDGGERIGVSSRVAERWIRDALTPAVQWHASVSTLLVQPLPCAVEWSPRSRRHHRHSSFPPVDGSTPRSGIKDTKLPDVPYRVDQVGVLRSNACAFDHLLEYSEQSLRRKLEREIMIAASASV